MPHALVGGAAMPAWGRIRATADADFLLLLEPGAAGLAEGLAALGYSCDRR
jgi:hypothetical protein